MLDNTGTTRPGHPVVVRFEHEASAGTGEQRAVGELDDAIHVLALPGERPIGPSVVRHEDPAGLDPVDDRSGARDHRAGPGRDHPKDLAVMRTARDATEASRVVA